MIKTFLNVLLLSISVYAVEKPNILWVVAEDMSQDLGCYGNEAVTTPNLDRLAENGIKFTHVFTNGPACSPSRTGLATGVFQTTIGAYHMRYSEELKPMLPKPYKILPELMREQGYYTGNIKKFLGTGTGKDDWLFKTDQKKWDTSKWEDLISKKPFFGQIHFSESHRGFKTDSKIPVKADKITIPVYYPDHEVSRKDWNGYLSEVNKSDALVGRILDQLQKDSLTEDTIIIFFSDHGRPMTRGKNWLYDSGTQVPMIIYIPEKFRSLSRYKPGSIHSGLLSGVDIVAESLALAGGGTPEWMQGRTFLKENSQPRKFVPTAVDRIGNINSCSRAVRTKKFKYIHNYKTPGSVAECATPYRMATHPIYHLLKIMGERGILNSAQKQLLEPIAEEELYDLEKDPFEINNLIGKSEYTSVHKELKEILDKWIADSGDKGFSEDSQEIINYFKEYGERTYSQKKGSIKKLHTSVESYFKN